MSKDVTINGTTYFGVSQVALNTSNGGTAHFKDVDEIPTGGGGAMESGTIVGNDTSKIEIPITSEKTHVAIWCNIQAGYDFATPYVNLSVLAEKGMGMHYTMMNVGGTGTLGYAVRESGYTEHQTNTKSCNCDFSNSNKIVITSAEANHQQKWLSTITYNWVAW